MARIRTIKPEFWQDEKISRLPLGARLLFIGLWNIADDVGRLRGNSLFVRSQVFPYEPKSDVDGWLADLEQIGVILRYQHKGESFIRVVNFLKHQQISKPSPSKIPSPESSGSPPVVLPEPSGETPSGTGNREQGMEQGTGNARAPLNPDISDLVFAYWADRLTHPRARLDDKRRKLIRARLSEGMDIEEAKLAIDGVLVDIQTWPERRKFDGIEYIFENRASVEKFADFATKGILGARMAGPQLVQHPPEQKRMTQDDFNRIFPKTT
jgi:hypothetical protein